MPTRDEKFPELWLEQLPGRVSTDPGSVASVLGIETGATSLPQVTGVSVTQGIKSILVSWASALSEATLFYEVQVSTDPDLADAQSFTVGSTRFEYLEAEQGTTYYFAVRARLGTLTGPFSGTVNTEPGQIITAHVEDQAVSDIDDGSGSVTTTTDAEWHTIASATVTFGAEDNVNVFVGAEFVISSGAASGRGRFAIMFNDPEPSFENIPAFSTLFKCTATGANGALSFSHYAHFFGEDTPAEVGEVTIYLIARSEDSTAFDIDGQILAMVNKV